MNCLLFFAVHMEIARCGKNKQLPIDKVGKKE